MKVDIDKLNNRIVERLRFLIHMRAHAQMLEFKIGDRVSFQPAGHPIAGDRVRSHNPTFAHGSHVASSYPRRSDVTL